MAESGVGLGLSAANGLGERFDGLRERMLLVGGMEIEINSAQWADAVALAEDDGDVFVESNAVAEVRSSGLIGFDGLVEQGDEGGLKFFGCFVETDDVLVVHLH